MRTIFLTLPFLILLSCREPIDLNFPASDAKLVIDGFITNVEKNHTIHITRSSGFIEGGIHVIDSIGEALVEILDDSGVSIALSQHGIGQYRTPLFKAEPEKRYKIIVQFEGEHYESSFQALPKHVEATKIRFEAGVRQTLSSTEASIVEQHGVNILLNLNPVNEQVYYHFLQRNFFIWEAFSADGVQLPNEFCYVRGFDRLQVDLFESGANGIAQSVELNLDFIPVSPLMEHEFSVQVVQLITNQESHSYWSKIKAQFENVGSQFDAAPNSITGNIKNAKGEGTLGFFGVYNESSQRLFFDNQDSGIPFNSLQEFGPCGGAPVPEDPCYDCLFARGYWSQLSPPDWWRDHIIQDDDGIGINPSLLGLWTLGKTLLEECNDPNLNGENRTACDARNCEQLTLNSSMTYTKKVVDAGRTTLTHGQFRIEGAEVHFLPNGGSIQRLKHSLIDGELVLIDESGGCKETKTYAK